MGPLFVATATCLPVWQCRAVVCVCGGLVQGDDCYSAGVGFKNAFLMGMRVTGTSV